MVARMFRFEVLYEHLNTKWHIKKFNWSSEIFYHQQKIQHDILKKAYSEGKLNKNTLSKAFGLKFNVKGAGKEIKKGFASINKASKEDREGIYNQNKGILLSYNDALLGLKKIWQEYNLGSDTYAINFKKNTPTRMSINEGTHHIVSNINIKNQTDLFKGDLKIKGVVTDFYYDLKFKGDCKKIDNYANNSEKTKISTSKNKSEDIGNNSSLIKTNNNLILNDNASPTFDRKGYANCILENMKNVSSDTAAKTIKEACTYKFSSGTSNSETVLNSKKNTATYTGNTIGIVSLPKNLNSCGSITTTRFPIYTGC